MPQPLDQASLQALLEALGRNSTEPGAAYENLRVRLIRFFEWNRCFTPEDLADTALDRLAGKIASGEPIVDPGKFAAGIARMLVHEHGARQLREQKMLFWLRREDADRLSRDQARETREEALSRCLESLSPDNRLFLERYYTGDASGRIRNRQQLAGELGIALNALRNRALRLRRQLEECTSAHLARMSRRDGSKPAITQERSIL